MPLRAVDVDGRDWYSFLGEQVQQILAMPPGTLMCPHCGAKMAFRRESKRKGWKVSAHFAHITKQCASDYAHHPESEAHHTAKQLVVDRLRTTYPAYRDAQWQTEARFDEIRRIADILFTFADGRRTVHEVQLSPQSQYDFIKRTDDYRAAGCDVMWWLGPRLRQHQDWCLETIGVVGYVDVDYDDSFTDLGDNKDRAA